MGVDEEDEEDPELITGIESGETGDSNFSFRNRASWIKGFSALLGGDPQKYGGDDETCPPLVRMISMSSIPAFESDNSAW